MSEGPIKEPTEERKRNQKAANQDLDRRKLTFLHSCSSRGFNGSINQNQRGIQ